MRLRYCLLVTSLLAGSVTAAAGQDPDPERPLIRRPRVRLEPPFRRPMMETYRFRMAPERMRTVERTLERARLRAQKLSGDRLRRMRERTMDRVWERLDRVREEHRVLRRRWRAI